MTDTPSTCEPDPVPFRIRRGDYPDTRDAESRARAGQIVRRHLWDTDAAGGAIALVARDLLVVRSDNPVSAEARTAASTEGTTDGLIPGIKLPIEGYELISPRRDIDNLLPDGASTNVFRSIKPKAPADLAADAQRLQELGVPASLNFIVPLGHIVKGDDFPEPGTALYPKFPPPQIISTGARSDRPVRVAIIDTGISGEERPDGWLVDVKRGPANIDQTDIMPPLERLDWFAGHGTFAAGVVQQVAPDCEIVAYRFTSGDGVGTEQDVAEAVLRAVQQAADDQVQLVINLSVGIPAVDGLPPLALQDAVEFVAANFPDVVIVASAGNDGTSQEMYPAAFEQVVGVGALTADFEPAGFSSFGPWVTCSCVGAGVVSTFVKGVLPPQAIEGRDDVKFDLGAFAVWSGTSFSAPQVSGAVARLSQMNGQTPREALADLLAHHRTVPNYGFILDELLPGTPAAVS